jgi:hypothetical protein
MIWTLIDTQFDTCHHPAVSTRVKRTYNLAPRTVHAVRELSDRYGVAPSQDAVVELAVSELQRHVREREESVTWELAAADPAFQAESQALEETYRAADVETWPPEPV